MEKMNRFKSLRKKSGISVPEAAKIFKCSTSMIYAIEAGNRMPGRKLSINMCKYYKCTMDELYNVKTKKVSVGV
jgi:DNA-binding XRE family transcriptional regulator